jgi:hypothetical protein
MRRGLLLAGLFSMLLLGAWAAQQSEMGAKAWGKFLGTWKQLPGADEATGINIEPHGDSTKLGFGCKQEGSCSDVFVGPFDGKPTKDSGNPDFEASFRKTGDRTMQEDGYSSGKLIQTVQWQLSPDGNTLRRTWHSVDPPGHKDFALVFDRKGGKPSKDDPFLGYWGRNWKESDAEVTTFAHKGDILIVTDRYGILSERDCDGKDHPDNVYTSSMYSCHLPDAHTYEMERKKNEKVFFSLTRKISDDGKGMVVIRKNAQGKTLPEWTFEKIK